MYLIILAEMLLIYSENLDNTVVKMTHVFGVI